MSDYPVLDRAYTLLTDVYGHQLSGEYLTRYENLETGRVQIEDISRLFVDKCGFKNVTSLVEDILQNTYQWDECLASFVLSPALKTKIVLHWLNDQLESLKSLDDVYDLIDTIETYELMEDLTIEEFCNRQTGEVIIEPGDLDDSLTDQQVHLADLIDDYGLSLTNLPLQPSTWYSVHNHVFLNRWVYFCDLDLITFNIEGLDLFGRIPSGQGIQSDGSFELMATCAYIHGEITQ